MVWDILVMAGSVLQIAGGTILIRNGPSRVSGLSGLIVPRTDGSNPNPEEASFVASQRVWVRRGSALLISGGIVQLASYLARWVNA
jgi:hypothetical protein